MQGGILALDLAKTTGWAYALPGAIPAPSPLESSGAGFRPQKHISGSKRFGHKGCDPEIVHANYEDWLFDMIAVHAPNVCLWEAPYVTGKTHQDTALMLLGMAAITAKCCYQRGIVKRFRANNATVRKHFIDKGTGKRDELKRMTIERCKSLGWTPNDDNEADALALLDYALACPKAANYMEPPKLAVSF